jgi:hypothetical protein
LLSGAPSLSLRLSVSPALNFPFFLEPDLVQIIPLQLASLRKKFTGCPDHIISPCSKIKSLREEGRETSRREVQKEKMQIVSFFFFFFF